MGEWIETRVNNDGIEYTIYQNNRYELLVARRRFLKALGFVAFIVFALLFGNSFGEFLKVLIGFAMIASYAAAIIYTFVALLTFVIGLYNANAIKPMVKFIVHNRQLQFETSPRSNSFSMISLPDASFRTSSEMRKFRTYNKAENGVVANYRGTTVVIAEGLFESQAEYLRDILSRH